ncbi:MAG: glyoxalase [Acidobacteria bacterium 13_1_20CM_4_56_7]|nr:MAG: glyoxalase [Acidobacteria bacterium 13_1_20CM_4_56_7]PYV52007.1 MAG: glyoxalase [Acidobacteriota bacterium]
MAEKTNPVPPGFHTLTPHLTVRDADKALEFYKNALGAEILGVARMPDGKIMHAALRIGDSMLMLNEEMPEYGGLSPLSLGGTAVTVHVYTDNVDDAFNRAVSAGAQVKMPLMDQFWGDRYGMVSDPFGHKWSLATHVKDLSPEEMQRAQDEAMANMPPPEAAKKTA